MQDYKIILRNLITGGAGFIGSHLTEKLLNQNEHVICVDNFSTGFFYNIKHLNKNPKFELINSDITIPLNYEVDRIWHLACPASRSHYEKDPINTCKTNFLGTLNMLNLAQENKAKFLLASTSEVYGESLVHPQSEKYFGSLNTFSSKACYAESKRLAESISFDYKKKYGVDIAIARIFNTYGPRVPEKDGRVISNFIFSAIKNKSLTIYGDGLQTRSFCYIDDLIEGITGLMESDYNFPVNLGNPAEEYSILELSK